MQERFQLVQLRVSKIIQETHDVKTFRLGTTSQIPFEFLPGQFIVLAFEIFDPTKGRSVHKNRAFSISSSPTEKNYLEITVKKTGRISTYLHEVVKEEDLLTIKNRSGEFYFQEGLCDELVLIAGGTGIAPLMSMIRYVTQRKLPVKITLLYSNKIPEDIIFYKEIQDLESRHSNFRCIHTITRPEGDNWKGPTGRINQELLEQSISNKQALFYICGPKAMIQTVAELLKGLKVDHSRIKIEKWD
ncbi:MAG: ferredoxin reductase [Nitrospira sp.]|nr:ferredoxin reductase [Nitrospira sp.]